MGQSKAAVSSSKDKPSSVSIRMYNVGFGDCFLLTIVYPKVQRHVLIDYGSTAAPKNAPRKYMTDIASDIKKRCPDGLDVLVETHRHRDHISGFATDGEGTGTTIASLRPKYVIQPWTEDPEAKPNAMTASAFSGKGMRSNEKRLTAQFLGSLEDMHRVSAAIDQRMRNGAMPQTETGRQLAFLGQNNLKNLSAVKNLISMGKKSAVRYVNSGMKLNGLLPNVKITVLGPPTLKQTESIRSQRARDPDEFWQFRSFWSAQRLAADSLAKAARPVSLLRASRLPKKYHPPDVRWFIAQSQRIYVDQTLEIVRDLDNVMNNTSVILLFEIGRRKLLFPGDAQIENWAYALKNKEWCRLLKDVNVYKVGHHGSLNATPKSLWRLFRSKGDKLHDRLQTLCSTKSGKHGSARSGTEVPRSVLVKELKANSSFLSTDEYKAPNRVSNEITIAVN